MSLAWICTWLSAFAFFVLERVRPGRVLPYSKGWYVRAVLINGVQFGVSVGVGQLWQRWSNASALLPTETWPSRIEILTSFYKHPLEMLVFRDVYR